MTELRIKLGNDPSKAEEIAALEKIREFFFNKDAYLKSLFTEDLVSWVSIKIRDDIGPDLYGWFSGDSESLSKVIKERDEAWSDLADKAAIIARLESEIGILKEERIEQKEAFQLLGDECMMLRTEVEGYTEIDNERKQVIIELKAELYDLMTQRKEKEDGKHSV